MAKRYSYLLDISEDKRKVLSWEYSIQLKKSTYVKRGKYQKYF